MKIKFSMFLLLLVFTSADTNAQNPASGQYSDPMASISNDISKITVSVQKLNATFTEFVNKFAKVEGLSLSEKQQKLVVGLELLIRFEQRVATLQKFQIELVEKEGTTRARLAQIDRDLRLQGLERRMAFEGSTQTPEIRESKRQTLQDERVSLSALLQQIESNLSDASLQVREAQQFVQRLRRTFLPQVERELSDQ